MDMMATKNGNVIRMKDGTQIYYKDWGNGTAGGLQPRLAAQRRRVGRPDGVSRRSTGTAASRHDRRGHGRSSQPWNGNEMDTYADDLAALVEALDLKRRDSRRPLHGRRRGRALHRPPRHEARGEGRADRRGAADDAEDGGQSRRPADGGRSTRSARASLADRSQFFKDLSGPFYGANRPGAKVSQGLRDSFWLQGMLAGLKAVIDCIKAFSETDFTEDLKKYRRADADHARRRRPNRADRRLRDVVVEARTRRDPENLSWRAARDVLDQEGRDQRRPPRVHRVVTIAVGGPGRRRVRSVRFEAAIRRPHRVPDLRTHVQRPATDSSGGARDSSRTARRRRPGEGRTGT